MSQSEMNDKPSVGGGSICPAEQGHWLASSIRRLVHNPEKILRGLIREGQTVADLGCGPGFFTIPMAELVGENGRVIAVDLQQGMLDMLKVRAERANMLSRIRLHKCEVDAIGVTEHVDFALAFYMVHEVQDVPGYLAQVSDMMKPDGRFLMVEPKGHVSRAQFAETTEIARAAGLKPIDSPRIFWGYSTLFSRD